MSDSMEPQEHTPTWLNEQVATKTEFTSQLSGENQIYCYVCRAYDSKISSLEGKGKATATLVDQLGTPDSN